MDDGQALDLLKRVKAVQTARSADVEITAEQTALLTDSIAVLLDLDPFLIQTAAYSSGELAALFQRSSKLNNAVIRNQEMLVRFRQYETNICAEYKNNCDLAVSSLNNMAQNVRTRALIKSNAPR